MTPTERLTALREAVLAEPEPVIVLTHLLRLCREDHALLWERSRDPRSQAVVAELIEPLRGALPSTDTARTLPLDLRRLIAEVLQPRDDVPPVVIAHAVATLIDEGFGHGFASFFRRLSPYRPGVGDPVPLDRPDLRAVTAMPATSPPWRLANRLDETRHLRLAGEWANQFQVVFDYSLYHTLADLITDDTVIAAVLPNRKMSEIDLSTGVGARRFPIAPADPSRQAALLDDLIGRAVTAGASIVVLPELSVTRQLALGLEKWVRASNGLRLLVAGSYHEQVGTGDHGGPRRRNTALTWVRGHEAPLLHHKHSPADNPVYEDIEPDGWPQLRVYVTADGWHLVVAICRDLLNPQAVHTLAAIGANLVLVPAMSDTLIAFGGPAAHLVGSNQAFVMLANNPAEWGTDGDRARHRPARALVGHPGLGQQVRYVHTDRSGAGVAMLSARSARIVRQENAADPSPVTHGPAEAHLRPAWLEQLVARPSIAEDRRRPPRDLTLRPAAVLVLLIDTPDGPSLLLTERASDLADYAGQLVFPGGVAESTDDSPAATALREAEEEVGLEACSVDVIGTLPAFALPQSGHVVTPVLAWAPSLRLSQPGNPAEVTSVHQVPLLDLCGDHAIDASESSARELPVDVPRLGRMTATVIDLLSGILTTGSPVASR